MASRSGFERLRLEGGQAPFPGWRRLGVRGRHRERFLASQVTSDVRALAAGESQLSSLLDASGRLQAFFFLLKREDSVELLVPDELLATVAALLEEHVVGDDVTLRELEAGPMTLALGPEAVARLPRLPAERVFPLCAYGERGLVCWGGVEPGLPPLDPELLEALRVVTGLPRWGLEVARGMLVNETTLLDSAVSFGKGCYLGQETVAKLHAHRGAAYAPALLRVEDDLGSPERLVGRSFRAAGKRAGVLRSWARWQGDLLLEASLFRDLRSPGSELEVEVDQGPTLRARVELPPLVAVESPEEKGTALYLAAVRRFADDAETEAVTLLERALAVCPGHADATEALGVVLLRRGELERAVAAFTRLLEVDPGSVMAHTNLSRCHREMGRIADAEREAAAAAAAALRRRAAAAEREELAVRERAGRAAERERREAMFREVLELDPADPLGHFGLGELCLEGGRFEEAVEHLTAALATEAEHSAAHLALARAWAGLNRHDEARAVYRRGLEVAARRGDLGTAGRLREGLARLSEA